MRSAIETPSPSDPSVEHLIYAGRSISTSLLPFDGLWEIFGTVFELVKNLTPQRKILVQLPPFLCEKTGSLFHKNFVGAATLAGAAMEKAIYQSKQTALLMAEIDHQGESMKQRDLEILKLEAEKKAAGDTASENKGLKAKLAKADARAKECEDARKTWADDISKFETGKQNLEETLRIAEAGTEDQKKTAQLGVGLRGHAKKERDNIKADLTKAAQLHEEDRVAWKKQENTLKDANEELKRDRYLSQAKDCIKTATTKISTRDSVITRLGKQLDELKLAATTKDAELTGKRNLVLSAKEHTKDVERELPEQTGAKEKLHSECEVLKADLERARERRNLTDLKDKETELALRGRKLSEKEEWVASERESLVGARKVLIEERQGYVSEVETWQRKFARATEISEIRRQDAEEGWSERDVFYWDRDKLLNRLESSQKLNHKLLDMVNR